MSTLAACVTEACAAAATADSACAAPRTYVRCETTAPVACTLERGTREGEIVADVLTSSVKVRTIEGGGLLAEPAVTAVRFTTRAKPRRLGVMIVGLAGSNGSTLAGLLTAHKLGLSWETKDRRVTPDYLGTLLYASTTRLGTDVANGDDVYVPLRSLAPLLDPAHDIVLSGWDITGRNLADAVAAARVLDIDLQRQLRSHLETMTPLPGVIDAGFAAPPLLKDAAAAPSGSVLGGSKMEQLAALREHIAAFKRDSGCEKVIVAWSGSTERMCEEREGLNDTAGALLGAVSHGDPEVSPSTLYALAAVLEDCDVVNTSPQNTFVRGLVELAAQRGVHLCGNDLRSGQTKIKGALAEMLLASGIAPRAIASYNHLGNNDGRALAHPPQFRSKEISKASVVSDLVAANGVAYPRGGRGDEPDHCVVIKYVPTVGDSKVAIDEWTNAILCGGVNTIMTYNVCEDSLLAAALWIDILAMLELLSRVRVAIDGVEQTWDVAYSLMSFMFKAPIVKEGTPVYNGFHRQRDAIVNFVRALRGLPPDDALDLGRRLQ